MSSELRIKREVAIEAYEAAKEKDRTIMRFEEFKFLGISTKEMDPTLRIGSKWKRKDPRKI